jgi:hypothetical protein
MRYVQLGQVCLTDSAGPPATPYMCPFYDFSSLDDFCMVKRLVLHDLDKRPCASINADLRAHNALPDEMYLEINR